MKMKKIGKIEKYNLFIGLSEPVCNDGKKCYFYNLCIEEKTQGGYGLTYITKIKNIDIEECKKNILDYGINTKYLNNF